VSTIRLFLDSPAREVAARLASLKKELAYDRLCVAESAAEVREAARYAWLVAILRAVAEDGATEVPEADVPELEAFLIREGAESGEWVRELTADIQKMMRVEVDPGDLYGGLSADESIAGARGSIAQGDAEVAVCAELLSHLGAVAVGGGA
jgi:hypothetical protein